MIIISYLLGYIYNILPSSTQKKYFIFCINLDLNSLKKKKNLRSNLKMIFKSRDFKIQIIQQKKYDSTSHDYLTKQLIKLL